MSMTNRGKALLLGAALRGETFTALYVALCTSATAPTVETNTLSQLTEIASGNGYTTGGYALAPGTTDFPTLTEDDAEDVGKLTLKNIVWTASGGTIPASGNPAFYAVLLNYHATVGSREVMAWWSLGTGRTASAGQSLTLSSLGLGLGAGGYVNITRWEASAITSLATGGGAAETWTAWTDLFAVTTRRARKAILRINLADSVYSTRFKLAVGAAGLEALAVFEDAATGIQLEDTVNRSENKFYEITLDVDIAAGVRVSFAIANYTDTAVKTVVAQLFLGGEA